MNGPSICLQTLILSRSCASRFKGRLVSQAFVAMLVILALSSSSISVVSIEDWRTDVSTGGTLILQGPSGEQLELRSGLPGAVATPPSVEILAPIDAQVLHNLTVRVSWSANGTESGINHTFLRLDSGNWLNVDGLSNFDAQLLQAGHHNVTICVFDLDGNQARDHVNFSVEIAPDAPESVNATAGASGISISWATPFDGGSSIISYKVFRSTVSGAYNPTPLATASIGTYLDLDVAAGTKYYYAVRASNSQGDSAASSEVNATLADGPRPPDSPTALTARTGMGFVSLSWTAPEVQGGGAVIAYRVYRTNVPGANPTVPIAVLDDGQRYYIDASLISGAYYYKVSAINFAEGPRSNESGALVDGIQPGSPGTIVGMSLIELESSIRLSWQPPPEGASPIVRYIIYRSIDPYDPILLNSSLSTTYEDRDVVGGQTLHYWIVAENSQGQGPLSAIVSGTVGGHDVGIGGEAVLALILVALAAGAAAAVVWTRRRP